MTVTATDLFCGAGGSTLGAVGAGVQVRIAANHWQTAIDVHAVNHPRTDHDCADISQVDPRRYPATDLLLAGPECTNHSQSRGISRRRQNPSLWDAPDPSAERSRATMWDVVRFAEQIPYEAVIVENVVEATSWVLWGAWWQAMTDLGYRGRVLSINSQDHRVPQSRDRIYTVWTRPGLEPDLELERDGWCAGCDAVRAARQVWKPGRWVGRYRQQWDWRCSNCYGVVKPRFAPAEEIIDWSLPTPRIGDRVRPLAAKTRARIWAGLVRHGWVPVTTQQATSTTGLAVPAPYLVQTAHGGDRRSVSVEEPHPTVCASDDRMSLIVPLRANGQSHPTSDPLGTVTAGGNHHALLMRNNTPRGDPGQMVTPVSEPARTMTTKGHQSLLVPYYGTVGEPVGTVTTRDRWSLVDPDRAVDDCGFRMLEPHEVAAAMGFPAGYIPSDLAKKDRVRLAGNAVTPPVMEWIVGRVVQAMKAAA